MLIEKIQPFAIALALGLLIGIERERSHPPGIQAMGLRTFVLFGLLGAIAAELKNVWIITAITVFVGAMIVMSYMRTTRHKDTGMGITTEFAAIITYTLGLLASQDALVTLIVGVVVISVLFAKERLHTFSRQQLSKKEFQATIIILILAWCVIPFLPNVPIDPWSLFNPRRFGMLVLLIAIMQFGAYAITRFFGAERGVLLTGFMTGFISSAIATATFSQKVKEGTLNPTAGAAAIVYSTISMYVKFLIVVELISPDLMAQISWPIFITILVGFAIAARATRNLKIEKNLPDLANPLALWSAVRLALVLGSMLILVTIAKQYFGTNAIQLIAFLGGFFDIHSVAYAVSTLHHESELGMYTTMMALGLTIIASFISKIMMVWSTKEVRFAMITTSMLVIMLVTNMIVWGLLMWK